MKRPLMNLLSLLFGDLGSRVVGFFITVYLARVLEPAGFGLMNLGLAVLGYLQLANSPGIQILETRNAAAFVNVNHTRVNAVLSLRLTLAVVLWMLVAGTTLLFVADMGKRDVIVFFSLSVFPISLMLDWFFQGKEQFSIVSTSRLIQYLIYGILLVVLVHGVEDVRLVPAAFFVGTLAATVVLWKTYTKQGGSIAFSWTPEISKDILVKGLPVGAAMFLAQSVTNLPPLVIGYFASTAEVGLFSSMMKLVFTLLIIDRLLNALFLPVITRYFAIHSNEIHKLVDVTLKVVSAFIIPLAVVGMIVGREGVALLYGGEYVKAMPLFSVLLGYFVLTVINSVFVCILVGSGRENRYARMVTWGSGVCCVAIVICTGVFGVIGAAASVVVGECITLLLMIREATKVVHVPVFRILARPFTAGVSMVVMALALQGMNPVLVTMAGLLTFALVEGLLKGITRSEIQFLRQRFV